MKNSDGTLGGGDLYSDRVADTKGNAFVNSRASEGSDNEVILQSVNHSRVEAGSNTSTVALRVVEGDEKGSLESESVKYGREYQETRTQE
jgi:hypothetical protein